MPQLAALQVAVPLAVVPHAVHVPQWLGSLERFASQPFAGLLSQSAKPTLQVKPHDPIVQFAVAFGGVGHVVPQAPHVAVVLSVASQPFEAFPSQLP
jgi:hypothetical protein